MNSLSRSGDWNHKSSTLPVANCRHTAKYHSGLCNLSEMIFNEFWRCLSLSATQCSAQFESVQICFIAAPICNYSAPIFAARVLMDASRSFALEIKTPFVEQRRVLLSTSAVWSYHHSTFVGNIPRSSLPIRKHHEDVDLALAYSSS